MMASGNAARRPGSHSSALVSAQQKVMFMVAGWGKKESGGLSTLHSAQGQ
jgi:hypothetical protein